MGAMASYSHRFFEFPENDGEFNTSHIYARIYTSADYYVSPRLRVNLSFSSDARFETEKSKNAVLATEEKVQDNRIYTYLRTGFVYSIY